MNPQHFMYQEDFDKRQMEQFERMAHEQLLSIATQAISMAQTRNHELREAYGKSQQIHEANAREFSKFSNTMIQKSLKITVLEKENQEKKQRITILEQAVKARDEKIKELEAKVQFPSEMCEGPKSSSAEGNEVEDQGISRRLRRRRMN